MDAPTAAERYLEGVADANAEVLGEVPPIYESGVTWSLNDVQPLPLAHTIARRGRGACGPLAAWRCAELRAAGEDARVRVIPSPSGVAGRWHAVVERADGSIEDPSQILRLQSGAPTASARPRATAPFNRRAASAAKKLSFSVQKRPEGYVAGVAFHVVGHGRTCVVGAPAPDRRAAAELAIKAARILIDTPALEGLTSARTKLALAAAEALTAGVEPEQAKAQMAEVAHTVAVRAAEQAAAQAAPVAAANVPGAATAPGGLGQLVPALTALAGSGGKGAPDASALLSMIQTQGPQALAGGGALGQLGQLGAAAPPPYGPILAGAAAVLNTPQGQEALGQVAGLLGDQVKMVRGVIKGAAKVAAGVVKGVGKGLKKLWKSIF